MKKLINRILGRKKQTHYYSTDVWSEVANKYNIKEKLWDLVKDMDEDEFGDGIIIYGEIYGPGIQGDKYTYGEKEHTLALFDVELNNEYKGDLYFRGIASMLELPVVDELYQGKWSKEIQDSLVLNQFIFGTKTPHEGIVVKCLSGNRQKVSKVINPDYLIFSEKNEIPDSH